jgi:indolepyruvate ferredoxin oxidoreductase beta subunit
MSEARPGAAEAVQPFSILIGALGGEGGGVLTDWLVATALAEGFPVQSTSIPGVAQRTGATTYYIEIFPQRREALGGREPVLALYPSPGRVDVAVMSELIEAGRALENGMVTPERTLLIASTHRVFAIGEKSAMGDGRFEADRVEEATLRLARRAVLFDMAGLAQAEGSVINAVLLGAIAGSGVLPFPRAAFERAIRETGVAVEANLRGFAAGFVRAAQPAPERAADRAAPSEPSAPPARRVPAAGRPLLRRIEVDFPEPAREVLRQGVLRLIDFQDARYAAEYLERMGSVAGVDSAGGGRFRQCVLTRETARYLALWMSYEDVIRVAQLKTRPARLARIRRELGARPQEPVQIREFLDPGLEEICAILPPMLARPLLALAERFPRLARWRRPMEVRTDTVSGFLTLWMMARLRPLRRWTYRFRDERALIDRWLAAVRAAGEQHYDVALEVAQCARLIKGYGDTYHRGRGNFLLILETLVTPALEGGPWPAAEALRQAREAALADPEGRALARALEVAAASPLRRVSGESRSSVP